MYALISFLLFSLALPLSPADLGPVVSRLALFKIRQSREGEASYYHHRFQGRVMKNGRRYDPHQLTAASNELALGSQIRVCRSDRPWRCVDVEVTDTGELFGRLLDLSRSAAGRLGILQEGVIRVVVMERTR